jgi:hypothetical protein
MPALGRPLGSRTGRGWLIGLAGLWLLGVLVVASPAAASHPPMTLGAAPAEGDAAAPDPALVETPPPAAPGTAALICLALLALPALLAARQWRRPVTLAILGLTLWFSAEVAFHSAHHVTEPEEGERCPVFTAAQHLPGVDPEPDVPVLERPAPGLAVPVPPLAVAARVVLNDEQARAPPARPA